MVTREDKANLYQSCGNGNLDLDARLQGDGSLQKEARVSNVRGEVVQCIQSA